MSTRSIALSILSLLTLGGLAPLGAQVPETLSLDEAINLALRQNQGMEASRLELEKADAQVDEALGNALPTVDLNSRYTWNIQRPVFFFPGEDGIVRPIEIGSKNALTADISVQQIIFNSAVLTGVGTSRIYARISRQQLRSEASEVILGVKQAYYQLLLAREVLAVNEALLANAEANYRNTKVLYDAGLRAEFDAIRAEVTVANLKPRVNEGRDMVRNGVDRLITTLGYDDLVDSETEVTGTFVDPATGGAIGESYDELERAMIENNPQLNALRLLADVNQELVEIDRSDYLPTVALFGTYKVEGQADNLGDLDFQPSAFAGVNLSLNLYNGGKTAARVEQSQVEYQKNRFQAAELESALRLQLKGTLRSMEAALDQMRASERTIEQAERAYTIATATYKAGTGTQLQINDADLALAQSKLNRLNSIYAYNVALSQLEHLIGRHVRLQGDEVEYVR